MNSWKFPIDQTRRNSCLQVISNIGRKLADPRRLYSMELAEKSRQQPNSNFSRHLDIALAFNVFHSLFPNDQYNVRAKEHLLLSLGRTSNLEKFSIALFGGISQLGYLITTMSMEENERARLIFNVDSLLNDILASRTASVNEGIASHAYDVISGSSGLAAYLLKRYKKTGEVIGLKRELRFLVDRAISSPMSFVTPEHLLVGTLASNAQYEHGLVNCGLAHGIPGPLIVLSLAFLHGIRVDGIESAIENLQIVCCNGNFMTILVQIGRLLLLLIKAGNVSLHRSILGLLGATVLLELQEHYGLLARLCYSDRAPDRSWMCSHPSGLKSGRQHRPESSKVIRIPIMPSSRQAIYILIEPPKRCSKTFRASPLAAVTPLV